MEKLKIFLSYVVAFVLGSFVGQWYFNKFLYQRPPHMPSNLMDFDQAIAGGYAAFFGGIAGITILLIARIILHRK